MKNNCSALCLTVYLIYNSCICLRKYILIYTHVCLYGKLPLESVRSEQSNRDLMTMYVSVIGNTVELDDEVVTCAVM